MKQITSFLLMMLFVSSAVFAQTTSTGLAKKGNDPTMAAYKLEQVTQQAPILEAEKSPMEAQKVMNSSDELWDVLYAFSAQAPSSQAVATDGDNFYLTYWNGTGTFDKFDMDGNYLSSFTLAGASAIRDLAYDGTYFYGAPSGGMSIAILDLANETLVGTIAISSSAGVTGSRHLAYDPGLDNGNGGFWLGQWGELAAVDMTGATIHANSATPAVTSCYGSAFDAYSNPNGPVLWLFTQNAGASPNDLLMLEEFDVNTLTFTGTTMDLFTISENIPGYIPGTAASQTIAGGAQVYVNADNVAVLAVNIQQSPNLVVGLELEELGPGLDNDVLISSITSPNSSMVLGIEDVIVNVKNNGTNTQSNIPFEVTVDGASFYSGTVAGPLADGEMVEVNCGTIDLSEVGGEWEFEACTMMAGDENPDNDCKNKTVTHIAPFYCDASTTTEDEWIANVLCGDIDNSSGWQGGVADYTDQFTNIPPGQAQDIVVTNGNAWASDLVTCWVDWNMNYEWEQGGEEEFILTSDGTGLTFTGAIEVPAGTPSGSYRMRVRMTYSTAPVPCDNASYGEVEDYTIQVGDPLNADVGVSAINMAGFYEPGTVTPMATVKNFGADAQTFDVTMTIGAYSSTMTVSNLAPAGTEEVTFDNWTAAVGSYTAEACTELAGDENTANDCKDQGITVAEGNFVYAYNAYDPSGALVEGPVTFDIVNPTVMELLAPTSSTEFIAGACWAADTWWGVMYTGGLYTISTETGDMTFVGTSPDLSGLAFDGETVYGASITDLYTIDPATGAGTLVGPMGNPSALMIGIGANAAGDLFGFDIGDDIFYSIDKTTGAATAVGPLGFNYNYAQDMAFDKANDQCYISGYTTTGGLYSVDYTTGAATHLGDFAGGAEITGFAIPSEPNIGGVPPVNFTAVYEEGTGVNCAWDYTEPGAWIGYDDGTNNDGLGLDGGGTFWSAIKFDAADLTEYDGQYMTMFKFFPILYANEADITFMIWEGEGQTNLVYEQVLTGLNWNNWNEITLDEAHMIDASMALSFGFEVTHENAEYPIGYDSGPAVEGYGDLVSFDGTAWETLSFYGLDYNYNLKGFVANTADNPVGAKEIIAQTTISNPNAQLVSGNFKPFENATDNTVSRELLGFHVYRDGVQVNTAIIPPMDRTYTDAFFTGGMYTYTAKAEYPDGFSDPTPGVEVAVGGPEIEVNPMSLDETHMHPGTMMTTQTLTITNTGVGTLDWEIPTPVAENIVPAFDPEAERILAERMANDPRFNTEVEKSPMTTNTVTNGTDEIWDVLYAFSAQAPSSQAVATDGDNFYLTYWNGTGTFDKFDMDGNYLSSFTLAGASAIRDLAYDGTYFYGAPSGGMSIAILDLANETLVGTIAISSSAGVTGSRHLAYDPGLDNGNGGFWLGQWGELAAVDMTGATIHANSATPAVTSCYGSAFDAYSNPNGPVLWLFTQNAGASPNDLLMLEEFDVNTLTFTGTTMDLFTISENIPGYIPGTAASQTIAGGAQVYVNADNVAVLAVNIQQSPNLVVGLELEELGPGLDNDVLISSITSPNSSMVLGIEDVIVNVKNNGTNTQSNIPFEVTVDGASFYSGTVAGPLADGEMVEVNCGTIDLSEVGGEWEFEACTMMAGDENPDNDCKNKTVTHIAPFYCDASTTTEDEWIANVLCGDIDNSSGWQGGVADYTDISTIIDAGDSEDIVVTNGNAWASDLVTCWVDWNMNYEWEQGGEEEFILTSDGTGLTFTGAIAPPAGTPNGEYRMRVRMTYSTAPVPCGNASYGEVEDYTIVVGGVPPADWLSWDPAAGSLAYGESETVTVTFNSTDLDPGTYTETITINSNAGLNPMVSVPVTLVVSEDNDPPIIDVDPLELTFALDYYQSEDAPLDVYNDGGDDLEVNMSITYGQDALAPVSTPIEYITTITPDQLSLNNTATPTPSPNVTDDEVIRYDDGINNDAIGLTAGGTFQVSAYWPAATMGQYAGMELTSIEIYINDAPTSAVMKIYDQGTATVPGTLLHEQTLSVNALMWNTIDLTSPVAISGNDIWIGYEVTHDVGVYAAGTDIGPAVAGYGDMISLDGVTFEPMSGLGLDYNWNIAASLSGEVQVEWLSINPMTATIGGGNMETFTVTADAEPFGGPTDEWYYASIWVASNDPVTPMVEVEVALLFPVGMREVYDDAYIMIFPNPTSDMVSISTNYTMSMYKVLNQLGQVVMQADLNNKSVSINTNQLEAGIYFVKITSEAGESTHKLIVE